MKEISDIIQAYEAARQQGKRTALATVVQVEGSSYRQPGARMLVTEDGRLTGAISGGCLEGDALRKALLVMTQQKPMLVTYDTSDEDDATLGIGLGCQGIIHILIEPVDDTNHINPVGLLKKWMQQRQPGVLVTMFSLQQRKGPQPGTCLLYTSGEITTGNMPGEIWQQAVTTAAQKALTQQQSTIKTYITDESRFTAFVEYLQPVVSLVIIGGGNDVMPVVQMAAVLGWQTTVIDGRPAYATAERFPGAHKVIVAKPATVLQHITPDEQTVFVLMTHNYNYELAVLRELLQQNISYTGILGPKKKTDRILNELKEEGIDISEQQLSKLYGPVGLDIGAETAEEIALAILSEIKAVLSQRPGAFLCNLDGAIHTRPHEAIEEIVLEKV